MKLGFIGIGNIGAPIASQLLTAGHSLLVHDLRPEAAQLGHIVSYARGIAFCRVTPASRAAEDMLKHVASPDRKPTLCR